MSVPAPVHARLTVIRAQVTAERGRQVTYPEVWEMLLDWWDQKPLTEAAMRVLAAGQECAR